MDDVRDNLRSCLRNLRNESQMTQAEAADAFGVPKATYVSWEHSTTPPPERLLSIAKHFGVSVDHLYAGSSHPQGERKLRKQIGQNIKSLRKLNRITQGELGELLAVSSGSISYKESGASAFSPEEMLMLADFFGISMDTLFGRDSVLSSTTDPAQNLDDDALDFLANWQTMTVSEKLEVQRLMLKLFRNRQTDPGDATGMQ